MVEGLSTRAIYVGDAQDVVRRILANHSGGNVEASALRKAVAEAMGYTLKRTRRSSGSVRVRIDLPNPREGENKVSEYLRSGKWKYLICNSSMEAKDFQWYVIEELNPLLNRISRPWNHVRLNRYKALMAKLEGSSALHSTQLRGKRSGPGVYIFYNDKLPTR